MLSVTRGSIGDLDEAGFRQLVREGEHLYVERKRMRPEKGFGPTVASFANMLGGWLLIGVLDNPAGGEDPICGWEPPSGEPQQLMTQQLRQEVDPLPAFATKQLLINGATVWAVRVFASEATPHIVLRTGAVYVRTMDGKQPIKDATTLLRLAERGREANGRAQERIKSPGQMPLLSEVFEPVPFPAIDNDQTPPKMRAWVVRALPVSLALEFADRVLSPRGYEESERHTHELQSCLEDPSPQRNQTLPRVRRRGYVFERLARGGGLHLIRWVTDAGGGIGVRVQTWAYHSSDTMIASVLTDTYFKPILSALAADLEDKEAYGRCLLDAQLTGMQDAEFYSEGHGSGQIDEDTIQLGGELVIPAEPDEIDAQARAWTAEVARAAGHASF